MIYPDRYQSLGELLWDALIQYKSEVAHIEMRRKKERHRLTYLEFKQEVERVVGGLKAQGIQPGDRVAILLTNQVAWLQAALATFLCGGVLVPLDYKLTAPEQQALLRHAHAKHLFIEYGLLTKADSWPIAQTIVLDSPKSVSNAGTVRWEDFLVEGHKIVPQPAQRNDIATIVYSSGTGGSPKGCMLPHQAYLEQYKALLQLYPMKPGDRTFSILPTNHAIDFMIGFIGPLCCGSTIVHQRTLRPEFILHTLKHCKITHMAVVPLILESLERALLERVDALPDWKQTVLEGLSGLNAYWTQRAPKHTVSRRLLKPIHDAFGGELKMLFCGGAFVDPDRASYFNRLGIPVVIGYGLTEACTVVTVNDLKPFRADSVGAPVAGVHVRIANQDNDGVGEVQIQGPTVMLGYLDDPQLTESAFEDGWLKTGDLGYLDASNHLHLVGRTRNLIVTPGGKNIYPEDIEHAFEQLPCHEVVVYASNYLWPGQQLQEEQLVIVVRPDANRTDWKSVLRQQNRVLPDFKRVRGLIEWPEDFPRTASMKIKRQELAKAIRVEFTTESVQPILM